ncbi:FAD/NAD(P)-binding protein [Streptomyces sp. PKU-EA00015]|uniref:FAD/NAD(P)-binding protein n=1 Tax=Streptomyces sp. PKU-EA00015 TaxID=2748326 RepID=UPI0015A03C36|nr:FAD/NAD(P)-binding protein [Streptomyces sp. PKU-EA00015]NWF27431.1 FAD/NAD(P)-binding protein [Streptomyces sp. PKU-EA00015]
MTTAAHRASPLSIAVIGTGPRGISVLERLVHRLHTHGPSNRPVRLYAIDAVEVGAGRVWRTDQPSWFTMNTVVGQVTMYSGAPDAGPARPGAGPSLGQWDAERSPTREEQPLGPDDYASRRRYGQYLRFVFDTIRSHVPPGTDLLPLHARVTALTARPAGGYHLQLDHEPGTLTVDKVVLATGHPTNAPTAAEQELTDFAARHPQLHYVPADSAAEMDLSPAAVPPRTTVGIRGMGLSFYDVMLSLTVGRGGTFVTAADGSLTYRPSGAEPRIVAASRSGLPIPARGRNQKSPQYSHTARFLTRAALNAARHHREQVSGSPRLDFAQDVLPLLLSEVEHVYCTTHVRTRLGEAAAAAFARRHLAVAGDPQAVRALLAETGLPEVEPPDIFRLARPFAHRHFSSPATFRSELLQHIRHDLHQAELGNHDGPLKAALDVLRDIRNIVREAVDHGGLLPHSHRHAFHTHFLPANALLSAGPPRERVQQLLALIETGLVDIAGPDARFTTDEQAGRFHVHSPQVDGSGHHLTALIEARIPTPALARDTSPLIRQLLADGIVSEYVVEDLVHGQRLDSTGMAVTPAPFHVIDRDGKILTDLYAIGIPTEHTRWFTQVGSSRPGVNTLFYRDADALAADLLTHPARPRTAPAPAHAAQR